MEDCIFCKIVKGEIPSEKIYEDEDFLAFADIKPAEEGHTLLISKKHFNTLSEVDKEVGSKFIEVIQNVGKSLMNKYNSTGFNITLNNGRAAGQVVGHVHFHLLPRREGDNKRGIFLG